MHGKETLQVKAGAGEGTATASCRCGAPGAMGMHQSVLVSLQCERALAVPRQLTIQQP